MAQQIKMTRRQAAELINDMREILSESKDAAVLIAKLRNRIMNEFEFPESAHFHPCPGEAHQNPHIDNCSICAPRWGWVGSAVVIR